MWFSFMRSHRGVSSRRLGREGWAALTAHWAVIHSRARFDSPVLILRSFAISVEHRGVSSRALDGRSVSPVLRPHWGLIHSRARFDSPML